MSGRPFIWRSGFLRAGPLGRRIGLRTTGGPDGAAAAGLIDRPSRPAGRIAALLDRTAVRMGVGRRVADPLADLETVLGEFLADADGAAAMHSSMPGRCLAALSFGGVPRYFLKIGLSDDHALRNEAEFLWAIPRVGLPIRVPELLFADHVGERYAVVTRAWPHSRPAGLLTRNELLHLTEVLGTPLADGSPVVHGDFAPWNVLRTPEGLALVDWEAASFADQPLRDLIHYFMQAGALLGWVDVRTVVRELTHPQGAVAELAERLQHPASLAKQAVRDYLAHTPAAHLPRARRFRECIVDAAGC